MSLPVPPGCSADQQTEPSFWRVVTQSLRGVSQNYTALPLNRAVLLLAIPMVLEMIMESLFSIANIFWVSRLGSEAVAVVGLTESVMSLIYAVAIGLSIAATAIVARRIGEKDPERAAQAAGQIIVLGAALSAGMGIVLGVLASDILRLMGAEEEVVALGSDFALIMLGGNLTVVFIFLLNAIFRGAGDAVLAMRTLWLANALNIILGPCFIYGLGPFPELGVTGAALATTIGRGIGVLYQLWYLAGHHSRVQVRPHHLRPVVKDVKAIMITASNGMGQLLIGTTSWIGLYKILASFGSSALAGFTIAVRIVAFVMLPASGLANAGATLVGQCLGAGKPSRAEQAIRVAARFNIMPLGTVGVFLVFMAHPVVSLFTTDPETLHYGTRALWIISLALPLYALGMCMGAAFNGAGDTWTPTRLNFFCFWLGQIPFAWFLAQILGVGPTGVFVAVPAAFSMHALWSVILFRTGTWKKHNI